MLQWTPLQPDREGIKEREDAEKGRVGGGGNDYSRDGYYYSRKYGSCMDGEPEIGL